MSSSFYGLPGKRNMWSQNNGKYQIQRSSVLCICTILISIFLLSSCASAVGSYPPVAAFTANVTSGTVPLTVSFTDQSTYSPTHWAWEFGDGGTSIAQHPTHTYNSAGTYTVTLYATNFEGTDIASKHNYITAVTAYSGGNGTDNDPYLLSTDSDIGNLSVNHADWHKYFRLTQDITLVGNHIPIGNSSTSFTGNFDGNGFVIKNLTVYQTTWYTGFFGRIDGADIYDLGVETSPDGVVSTASHLGGLVGDIASGNVSNCSVTGDVTSNYHDVSYVGGLVGSNSGTVINCSATVEVTLSGPDTKDVGGLVGYNSGTLSNSYATGTVTGTQHVGGFVGRNYGTVINCYVTSDTIGNSYVGGLVGFNYGNVSNCYATSNATGNYAGGLVGYINSGNVSNCFATGTATSNNYVGGLVGYINGGNVSNSYYSGTPASGPGTQTSDNNFTSFAFVSGSPGLNWNAGGNIITKEHNSTFIWKIVDGFSLPYFQYQSTTIDNYPVNPVGSSSPGSRRSASIGPSQLDEIVKSTHTSVMYIMGGTSVEYDLSGTGCPILAVSFDAKDNKGRVVAKVQVLSSTPEGISTPSGDLYELMSIDVGSQGTISSHNADNILIRFKVSQEWIRENNIDPSTIRLTRYHDGQWNDLPTYQEREEDDYIYFYSETPGFSIFSVVGDKLVPATGEKEPADAAFSEEAIKVPLETEDENTPGFTGLMGLLFVTVACVAIRRYRL